MSLNCVKQFASSLKYYRDTIKYWMLDALFRELCLMLKYYSLLPQKNATNRTMIFVADGKFPHGGMFDRLKGLISVYAASKVLKRDFRIAFTSPFFLEKYLEPNKYDWRIKDGEFRESIFTSRMVFMYGEYSNPYRLLKKRHRNAHFYYGYNSLEYINRRCDAPFNWGNLYRELFKPTPYLQSFIDREKQKIGGNYIAIHLRFLNLLGDKNEFDIDPTLPIDRQQDLMEKALDSVKRIIKRHSCYKVMLASDSSRFVEYAKQQIENIYTVPGEIRHIGTASDTSDGSIVKMFLDYYMISNAEKVYNLVGPGMWKSAFPEYAAKIGDKDFERIIF